jgi:hypothetical protein
MMTLPLIKVRFVGKRLLPSGGWAAEDWEEVITSDAKVEIRRVAMSFAVIYKFTTLQNRGRALA